MWVCSQVAAHRPSAAVASTSATRPTVNLLTKDPPQRLRLVNKMNPVALRGQGAEADVRLRAVVTVLVVDLRTRDRTEPVFRTESSARIPLVT
jgi:hypothetical protein